MRRWLFLLAAVLALTGMIAWRLQGKRAEEAAQARARTARMGAAPSVATAPAALRDIVRTFEGVGTVEAPLNVTISPKVTGRIDFLEVHEGDAVRRGQVLVRIDRTEIRSQVQQQEAALAQARSRLAQAQITQSPTNVSVSTQIAQQQAAVASAEADYNQARKTYLSQVAAAAAAVTEARGKLSAAEAAIGNADAAIRSAQANLDNARSRQTRVTDLYRQGFVAAQDVDDARTNVSVQQGGLDVARSQRTASAAQRDAAAAQVQAAENQADVVREKGKADVEAARARLAQARAGLKYARANVAQKPAYRENIAALTAAVAAARAAVQTARAQLSYTVLTSPIDGFVTARAMDPGAMASPGQRILVVQDIRQVWVTVPVPEEQRARVAPGQAATVRLDAIPGRAFTGRITQANTAADPLSRQFTARVTVDNPRHEVKPGMFARVRFVTERVRKAVVVPREAVQESPEGPSVIVVDASGEARRRAVTTGASDAEGIAVTDGLQPGETVVTLSSMPLKDGQRVRAGGDRPRAGRGERGPGEP